MLGTELHVPAPIAKISRELHEATAKGWAATPREDPRKGTRAMGSHGTAREEMSGEG